jgi:hypothetical protein
MSDEYTFPTDTVDFSPFGAKIAMLAAAKTNDGIWKPRNRKEIV